MVAQLVGIRVLSQPARRPWAPLGPRSIDISIGEGAWRRLAEMTSHAGAEIHAGT
jgi:hypothetical protein